MNDSPGASTSRPLTLGQAWSRLREKTLSKRLPQFLVAFFYFWTLLWHSRLAAGSQQGIAIVMIPMLVAGCWFYGIVLARVLAAAPVGRSLSIAAVRLLVLFMGYTVWLAVLPPTSRRSWLDWTAWVLVLAGLLSILVVFKP
jgi:hypothetical protein